MTDKYSELRAALDAGPKPGKWTWKQVGSFTTPGCAVFWPDTSKGGVHYRRLDSGGGMEHVDAEFIAACHPEAIRALLAERDAMEDALTEYANPENWEHDEHGWARLWLEPDSTSRRSYDGTELARAALAQGEV